MYSTHPDDSWDIWIMNADGSDRRPLLEDEADSSSPAWSPDGTRIVFHSDREGEADNLYLYDLDTEEITQLTNGPASDRYATWSPDGDGSPSTATATETNPTSTSCRWPTGL